MEPAGTERRTPWASGAGRILVADDDHVARALLADALVAAGHQVITAANGKDAVALLGHGFDVVVTDIVMPEMTGIDLLRTIRERDADIPVVLVTGSPEMDSALEAIQLNALLYLSKPVDLDELERVIARAVRLRRIARLKQEALALVDGGGLGGADRMGLEGSFKRALDTLWMAYQPVVRSRDGSLYAYEALLRSREASLPHPGAILDAAERLGRLNELGRAVRAAAVVPLERTAPDVLLFVNLHARDLSDPELFSPAAPLSRFANRVVLEITERAALDDVANARNEVARLRELGFRIAVDDLGEGYAGLTSFVTLEPQIVKLDMSLVRGIDQSETKQRLVRSVACVCNELGMAVVGEGVETTAERDVLIACGCDLLQGYLFGRPGEAFPAHTW